MKELLYQLHSRGHFFCAHFDFLGGSDNSNDDIFVELPCLLPFSISPKSSLNLGVGGTSSILVKPLFDLLFWTSLGNVDRRGVRAVATFLADLRIVLRTSHDRFLATYHSIDEPTVYCQRFYHIRLHLNILPKRATTDTQTTIAMIPVVDIVIEPDSLPAAPASESPTPAVEPTSPATGPSPGC